MQPGHFEEVEHEDIENLSLEDEKIEGAAKNSDDEEDLAAREEREYLAAMGEITVPNDGALEQ